MLHMLYTVVKIINWWEHILYSKNFNERVTSRTRLEWSGVLAQEELGYTQLLAVCAQH